ncbi:MAG: NAD(P)-dependent oxidoreductase [Candidatus Sumerlaeota bacterium]|nr:NAD(P)-dependent oxidoreductase [Candidatus Sumerlaeota bacterium]
MRVLVTGGAGSVGGWVVKELIRRGHAVTVCGRTPGRVIEGARYETLDCTDLGATRRLAREHDTVAHLAAIPIPGRVSSPDIFRINCLGTYHVFEACVEAGIKKLAVASSINALGQKFGVKPLPVRYFPIDEDHPQLCSDPYSFSKKVTEEIGEFYWERHGVSSVSIRLPWVVDPIRHRHYILERKGMDPRHSSLVSDYWTWLDARDSALVFALGIEVPYEGAHTLFAVDSANCLGRPSRELAAMCFPEVTDWREPIAGDESLVSCRRAKALLGWEPVYRFKDVFENGA